MLNLDNEYIQHHDRIHQTIITKHSSDSHNILTPLELCDEIISKVHNQNNFKSNTKVLILCNIEFIKVLQLLYNILNINMDNVYFVTVCSTKAKLVRQFGCNIIVYKSYKEFFEDNDLPKFDVVIGNPPFQMDNEQRNKRGSKGSTKKLWPLFTKVALDIINKNGIIALIHPLSWLSGTRDIAKGNIRLLQEFTKMNLLYVNTKIGHKYFSGIGSTFGYYIIQNSAYNNMTLVETETENLNIDFNLIKFLPRNLNKLGISINKKLLFNNSIFYEFKSIHPADFNKDDRTENLTSDNIFPIYACGKNGENQTESDNPDCYIYYTNKSHKFQNNNKIIINKSVGDTFQAYVDDGKCGLAVNSMVYIIKDEEKFSKLGAISYFNSKLIRFLFEHNKFSGWINYTVIKRVPKIDLSKIWSDTDLYQYFNLTNTEIKYIEDNVR